MKTADNSIQTFDHDFSLLTEENRENVREMIKFLIILQNSVVPGMLNFDKKKLMEEDALNNNDKPRGGQAP